MSLNKAVLPLPDPDSPSQEEHLEKDLKEKMTRAIKMAREVCKEALIKDDVAITIMAIELSRKLNTRG